MTRTGFPFSALLLMAAFAAGPAFAADPDPIATADAKAAPLSTADQIDNYLKTSPALQLPAEGANGVTPGDEPRKVHGEVSVAVGTGGYRDYYARADVPVGKTGTVSVALQQGQRNGRFGSHGYQNLGLGFAFGDAAAGPNDERCRRLRDGEPWPMQRLGRGERFRACRTAAPPAADGALP